MNDDTKTWPDLAIGLYDRLTGRNARITYTFDSMRVGVPSAVGADSDRAEWILNGTISITTENGAKSPN